MPHLHFISFRINVIATWMTLFYASKLPLYANFLALVLFSANLRKRVFFFFFLSVSIDRKVSASVLILKVVFLKTLFGIYFPFFFFFEPVIE